jgi:hypothetical protein
MRWMLCTFATFIVFVCAATARSEMTANEFVQNLNYPAKQPFIMMYLHGLSEGLEWYNAGVYNIHEKLLFCHLENVPFTMDQYISIFKRYLDEFPNRGGMPAGAVLLMA